MRRLSSTIGYIISGVFLLSILGGCATEKTKKMDDLGPEELLARGLKRFEKSDHNGAVSDFQAIKDRYPYSKSVIMAELKMADSYYIRKDFDSALGVYDDFERLHPKDSNIPFVMYQKGLCNLQQVRTIDRDQTHTVKAKEEFERLVNRFPESEWANKARANIRKCLVHLAKYELYIGRFYFNMGEYGSALDRFTYLIQNYPDMGQYHEALEYISRCKQRLAGAD
jgi:outer membrane protein assembly factor BamD